MKIKKTVSEKVIAANRTNAHASRGPSDCTKVKHNAVRHGFQAKQVFFTNPDEEKEYNGLLEDLGEYYQPQGPIELMLVEEIAKCRWKLEVLDWEMREIANRRKAAKAILRAVAENYDGEHLPLFTAGDGSGSAAQRGWDCQELLVRTGTRNFEKEGGLSSTDKVEKGGHVQIEARFTTSMDLVLRYGTALKRDLYRAIQTLEEMQRRRAE